MRQSRFAGGGQGATHEVHCCGHAGHMTVSGWFFGLLFLVLGRFSDASVTRKLQFSTVVVGWIDFENLRPTKDIVNEQGWFSISIWQRHEGGLDCIVHDQQSVEGVSVTVSFAFPSPTTNELKKGAGGCGRFKCFANLIEVVETECVFLPFHVLGDCSGKRRNKRFKILLSDFINEM